MRISVIYCNSHCNPGTCETAHRDAFLLDEDVLPGRMPCARQAPEQVRKAVAMGGLHQDPCVCGTYGLCRGVRHVTADTWRDLHRAYND